jgi:hypothetical protein
MIVNPSNYRLGAFEVEVMHPVVSSMEVELELVLQTTSKDEYDS